MRSQTVWFSWSNESAVDKKCDLCVKQNEKLLKAASKTKTRQDTGKKLLEVVANEDLGEEKEDNRINSGKDRKSPFYRTYNDERLKLISGCSTLPVFLDGMLDLWHA